ncbi:hypothetical protein ACI799_02290 [Blastococcus sp. SYSU DS0753]
MSRPARRERGRFFAVFRFAGPDRLPEPFVGRERFADPRAVVDRGRGRGAVDLGTGSFLSR